MKKIPFLHRLYKEEKLQLVEPNDDVKTAYLQKSVKSLSSAKALLDIGNLEDSVSMAYYAMYHALLALLFCIGVKCENHTAAIILLKAIFSLDNQTILKAKAERVDKQYYIDFSITKKETEEAIRTAEDFIAQLKDFIDKLTHEKTKNYHDVAEKLIKNEGMFGLAKDAKQFVRDKTTRNFS